MPLETLGSVNAVMSLGNNAAGVLAEERAAEKKGATPRSDEE
ncbi:MAG: hypothetical protein Q4B91_01705 [Atopobiaceae bacterium]|nr:hypothetical protein [Atopobiaceae bacterium]